MDSLNKNFKTKQSYAKKAVFFTTRITFLYDSRYIASYRA